MYSRHELDAGVHRAIDDIKELLKQKAPCTVEDLSEHLCPKYPLSVLKVIGTNPFRLAGFLSDMPNDFTVYKNRNGEWLVDQTDFAETGPFEDDDEGPPPLEPLYDVREGPLPKDLFGEKDVPPLEKIPFSEESKSIVFDAIRFLKRTLEQRGPCPDYVLHGDLSYEWGKAALDLMGNTPFHLRRFLMAFSKDFTINTTRGKCFIYLKRASSSQKDFCTENLVNSAKDGQESWKTTQESNGWAGAKFAEFPKKHFNEDKPGPFLTSRTLPKNVKSHLVTQQDVLDFVVRKLRTTDHSLRCKHLVWMIRQEAPELLDVTGPNKKCLEKFLKRYWDMFSFKDCGYIHLKDSQVHAKCSDCIKDTGNCSAHTASHTIADSLPRECQVCKQYSDHAQVLTGSDCSTKYEPGCPSHSDCSTSSPRNSCSGTREILRGRGRIMSIKQNGGVLEAHDGTAVTFGPHCTYLDGEPVSHHCFSKNTTVNFEAVPGNLVATATKIWL